MDETARNSRIGASPQTDPLLSRHCVCIVNQPELCATGEARRSNRLDQVASEEEITSGKLGKFERAFPRERTHIEDMAADIHDSSGCKTDDFRLVFLERVRHLGSVKHHQSGFITLQRQQLAVRGEERPDSLNRFLAKDEHMPT